MCELLGMSFNRAVNPKISFKGFQQRGKNNPDGWGIAYYPDKSVQIFKENIQINTSKFVAFLKNYPFMNSKIFIAHVRRKSTGKNSHMNTHPFCRELNGKEYLFAHNGTIRNLNKLNLGRFKPIGETDSEHIFCYLLESIKKKNIINWNENEFKWLGKKLNQINKFGKLNCLMSNGEYLFCYHDIEGYNGLYFTQRKPPYGEIMLEDIDWKVNLREEKDPNKTGFIIATNKLTNEGWEQFNKGELIVFKDGKMIYSK